MSILAQINSETKNRIGHETSFSYTRFNHFELRNFFKHTHIYAIWLLLQKKSHKYVSPTDNQ